jgi:beta-lactamase class A
LRERLDPGLQARVVQTLERLGLTDAVKRRRLSLVLADITDPRNPRVATVNGDEMLYAASLPKIAILLGAFVKIERGDMALDADTRRTLTDMIRVSSNRAATEMLHRVGERELAGILRSPPYRLYDPTVNGGLWVGKEYGKARAWKRDPLHHLSHGATAMQVARFYYLLETGRLVSPERCTQMKEILSKPGIDHKFVKGLADRPGVKIYRKSGSWRRWHADSAIVEADGHRYIIVALAEDPKGGQWMTRMIGPLHDLIVPERLASARSTPPGAESAAPGKAGR